jgi:hypothetical protein
MDDNLDIIDIDEEEEFVGVGLRELLELVVHGEGRDAPRRPEVSNHLHDIDG